jgi:hypothetical protein
MTAVELATWVVRIAGLYLAAGLAFSIPFVLRGAGRIDPVAREGSWGFRALIIPGVVALWPLLLKRWISGATEPPPECDAHRRAARERSP